LQFQPFFKTPTAFSSTGNFYGQSIETTYHLSAITYASYISIGGHVQTKLRSPNALSTRPTVVQNFMSRKLAIG
jgi:hypothetical protein